MKTKLSPSRKSLGSGNGHGRPAAPQKPRRMLINGRWVEAESGGTFSTYNPATGEAICNVPAVMTLPWISGFTPGAVIMMYAL